MKECKCLEIIQQRINEISQKTTPMESMSEKDFHEIQALLKISKKIQESNNDI